MGSLGRWVASIGGIPTILRAVRTSDPMRELVTGTKTRSRPG